MPPRWEEKRRSARISVNTPLRCQIRGVAESNNAVMEDIGIGGIRFINDKFIPTDTYVNLELNILSKVIATTGKIVRVNSLPYSHKFELGIEFLEFDPLQKKYLTDYMSMRLGKL
jgi:c-di-GMP-binding flagellar brake protein YcgR